MCRISNFSNIPLIAVCIIAGAPLMAQVTTGTMVGTVKNRSGKVIANATIRITSPNLMSPRTLKSDEKGNWRAGFLPPGEYRVSFSMDGYQGRAIQDLRVGADTIVRADISLNTADVAGTTVEITGEGGATIDKSEAKVGYNYSADDLFSMPVTMDAHGAAFLTAGAVDDGSGYSLRGGMTNATMYRLDGVDIKNDYRGGVTGTGYLADLIQDIQVNLSPVHPRYGRSSGGALNVVTKNGSNTFSGTVRVSSLSRTNTWTATKATWPDADFESDRFDDTLRKDYHVTLLGPVIKDKLWFSFGARLTPGSVSSSRMNPLTNYQILHDGPMRFANTATASAAASPNAVALNEKLLEGPDGFHYPYSAFNVGEYYLVSNNRDFYQGKLTYSLTENHSLEYSISTEKTIAKNSSQYGGGENYIMASMLGNTITETTSWGIGYTGVYGSSTFVEARYNSYESNYDKPKYVHPLIKDPINVLFGNLSGGGGFSNDQWARAFTAHASHGGGELSGNKSWSLNAKHYWYGGMGGHETEIGIEGYKGRLRSDRARGPNNRFFWVSALYIQDGYDDANDTRADWRFGSAVYVGPSINGQSSTSRYGPAAIMRLYEGNDGESNTHSTSIFAADTWNITDNWNVMLGARYDQYKIIDTDRSELAKSSMFIPRAMLKYDPTGDSKHLITLTYALYADDFYGGFTRAFVKTAESSYREIGWTGKTFDQPVLDVPLGIVPLNGLQFFTYEDLINMENWKKADGNYNTFGYYPSSSAIVDPNMKPTIAHEVSLRYQRQFDKNSTVAVSLTKKTWQNLWAIKQEYDPSQWVRNTDPVTKEVFYSTQFYYGNAPELKRDYFGLEIDFNHKFNRIWSLRTSLGHSSLKGNDNSGDAPGQGFRDTATTQYFYNKGLRMRATPPGDLGRDHWITDDFAPYGYLSSHQLLKGRMTVTGAFPLHGGGNVTFALMGEYDTRGADTPTANVSMGSYETLYPLPTDGNYPALTNSFLRYFMPRGAWTSNDDFRTTMNMSWRVPVGIKNLSIYGSLIVYNLFNNVRQTRIYKTYGSSGEGTSLVPLAGDTLFGSTRPGTIYEQNYYNAPRSLTFNIGLRF